MTQTILLADDSTTIQRLVAQTFEDADYTVVSVSNGEAAVRKFEDVRPTIVLADIYMPGKNGYEVCSFVKAHPTMGKTPVILLVGAFEAFDEAEAENISLASGQVSLHDVFLYHGSEPNHSDSSRRGMTLRFMPTTSVYRHDITPRTSHNGPLSMSERTVYLMRGADRSGQNDFRMRQ